jgi:hypothetical protein
MMFIFDGSEELWLELEVTVMRLYLAFIIAVMVLIPILFALSIKLKGKVLLIEAIILLLLFIGIFTPWVLSEAMNPFWSPFLNSVEEKPWYSSYLVLSWGCVLFLAVMIPAMIYSVTRVIKSKSELLPILSTAAGSFFSLFVGWLIPSIGFQVWRIYHTPEFGYWNLNYVLTSLELTFFFWLFVGFPICTRIGKGESTKLWVCLASLTAATTVLFLPIGFNESYHLIWSPILIGLIGGGVFWLLEVKIPFPSMVSFLVPVLFCVLVRYLLYPLGIAYFPYTTFVATEGMIENFRAECAVIERVQIGDTFEELNRRYPKIFDEFVSFRSVGGDTGYRFEFDKESRKIVEVNVKWENERR